MNNLRYIDIVRVWCVEHVSPTTSRVMLMRASLFMLAAGLLLGTSLSAAFAASTPIQRAKNACAAIPQFQLKGTAQSTPLSQSTQPAECLRDPAWAIVSSPDAATYNSLRAVAVISATDVWAVGFTGPGGDQTLTMHWNGTEWRVVPSPNPGQFDNSLSDVAAVSTNDIWAVGNSDVGNLVLHWDGSQWNVVAIPYNAGLNGVTALAANDVWAVGSGQDGSFTMHWNGIQWSQVPAPQITPPPGGNVNVIYLSDVVAIASDDVWAVGSYSEGVRTITWGRQIMHWDGTQWSLVPLPMEGSGGMLYSVAAVAADDVWAVGFGKTLHWDGTQWNVVLEPPLPADTDVYDLEGITTLATNDVWAVGGYDTVITGTTGTTYRLRTLTEHWDGSQWSIVSSPNPASDRASLANVAALSSRELWAVGGYTKASSQAVAHTNPPYMPLMDPRLSKRTRDRSLPAQSTQDGTQTGGTQDGTQVAEDYFRGTLIERYSDEYGDVLPGSTFYSYIRCLTCRGILSGYDDGTFRPSNPVTRGQLSKIVANAAGFGEPPIGQTFADVPPDSPFYPYIERMSTRNIIGGYPCGTSEEEACDDQHRPYFRPGSLAGRGQISKIVVNSAIAAGISGWQLVSPYSNTFHDVPVGSPFFSYVETAYAHSVLSGYPCGSVGEVCDNQSRPYLRPGDNASRGQSAKIISNIFFKDCQLNKK